MSVASMLLFSEASLLDACLNKAKVEVVGVRAGQSFREEVVTSDLETGLDTFTSPAPWLPWPFLEDLQNTLHSIQSTSMSTCFSAMSSDLGSAAILLAYSAWSRRSNRCRTC